MVGFSVETVSDRPSTLFPLSKAAAFPGVEALTATIRYSVARAALSQVNVDRQLGR